MNTLTKKVKHAALAMQRHSWEQGVLTQALLEAGDMDTVIWLAKEAAHRQLSDGRAASIGADSGVTDPCANGEGLLSAYKYCGDKTLKTSVDKLLEWAIHGAPRNSDGIVYHILDTKQFWVDTLYMLPPFLCVCGEFDEALKQINGNWNALYNTSHHMLSHKWDDEKQEYLRAAAWGVGNGWALAGLARVIDTLPASYSEAKELNILRVSELLDTILPFMREDGMFHDVIDDSNTFVDTNSAQMFAYTIFRGIKNGWLSAEYEQSARKMRAAARKKVDEYGIVCDACGAPHFDKPGAATEAQAFFILMETAAVQ
jgi:rhamnogalacturonyl hydrolase YesR